MPYSEADRNLLRGHAWACIRAAVTGLRVPPPPEDRPKALEEKRGVFVSVLVAGELRGCIGRVRSPKDLLTTVGLCAAEAATKDPRYPGVSTPELEQVEIDIAILDEPRPVEDASKVVVGRHGVIVSRGERAGLLLPQVAEQRGWDAQMFVAHAALKAGFAPAELGEATIEVFETEQI